MTANIGKGSVSWVDLWCSSWKCYCKYSFLGFIVFKLEILLQILENIYFLEFVYIIQVVNIIADIGKYLFSWIHSYYSSCKCYGKYWKIFIFFYIIQVENVMANIGKYFLFWGGKHKSLGRKQTPLTSSLVPSTHCFLFTHILFPMFALQLFSVFSFPQILILNFTIIFCF